LQAWGQEYQRAKDVLRGSVSLETTLYQFPSPRSKKVIKLPKNTQVLIYGKQGGFLDVRYQNLKGWGDSRHFSIQGTAAPEEPKAPEPIQPQMARKSTTPKDFLPVRLNPFLVYSMEGKSFDPQLRAGFMATYSFKRHLSTGLVVDAVFIKGTYLDIGPVLRHQWKDSSRFFNPAIYAGLLYYTFDHDGDKDAGLGIQTAIENEIPIMRDNEFQPSISMKLGTDFMFFYFDEVRIPVFLSAGATFKF